MGKHLLPATLRLLLALLGLSFAAQAPAQGFNIIPTGKRIVEIPFDYSNNFIILTVQFNKILPLKFILDTGAEYTILSKREISDLLRVRYDREFHVAGSDLSEELVAYLARQVSFDIADKVSAPQEDILVLKEDYFRFEEYAGLEVHGIMSASIFSKYIIKINYQKAIITLYDRRYYSGDELGENVIPMEVFRNKMYLQTQMQILPDSVASVKLLLDTGASLPLLLFSDTHRLLHPPAQAIPSSIGMGLGGYVEGYAGRVYQTHIGPFVQRNAVAYFQTLDSLRTREYVNKRNGLIGNGILSRYILIIDYYSAKIWLKTTRHTNRPFDFDRSGLFLVASGLTHRTYTVQAVIAGSPAEKAGFEHGDVLQKIRRLPVGFFSLDSIQRMFQKKEGKKIRVVVKRGGKKLKKTIVLRDLL